VQEMLIVGQFCYVCYSMSPTNNVYTTPSCTMDIILIDMYNVLFVVAHVVYDGISHDYKPYIDKTLTMLLNWRETMSIILRILGSNLFTFRHMPKYQKCRQHIVPPSLQTCIITRLFQVIA
jgi:hypothetical protein